MILESKASVRKDTRIEIMKSPYNTKISRYVKHLGDLLVFGANCSSQSRMCCSHSYKKGTICVIAVWFKNIRTFESSCTFFFCYQNMISFHVNDCIVSLWESFIDIPALSLPETPMSNHHQKWLLSCSQEFACFLPSGPCQKFRHSADPAAIATTWTGHRTPAIQYIHIHIHIYIYTSIWLFALIMMCRFFDPVNLSLLFWLFCCVCPRSLLQHQTLLSKEYTQASRRETGPRCLSRLTEDSSDLIGSSIWNTESHVNPSKSHVSVSADLVSSLVSQAEKIWKQWAWKCHFCGTLYWRCWFRIGDPPERGWKLENLQSQAPTWGVEALNRLDEADKPVWSVEEIWKLFIPHFNTCLQHPIESCSQNINSNSSYVHPFGLVVQLPS